LLLAIFYSRHPWRSSYGPTLRVVKNCSWQFFIRAIPGAPPTDQRLALLKIAPGNFYSRHPWRCSYGPTLRVVKNCSWQFFYVQDVRNGCKFD
jgi:hypothetical protein